MAVCGKAKDNGAPTDMLMLRVEIWILEAEARQVVMRDA